MFQVVFAWQNVPEGKLEAGGFEDKAFAVGSVSIAKFDLTLTLQEVGAKIAGGVEYATGLFEQSTLKRLFEIFLASCWKGWWQMTGR